MWFHEHPYPPYIPENTTRLIVGTFPPPRFSTGDLDDQDIDFVMEVVVECYGKYGIVWMT